MSTTTDHNDTLERPSAAAEMRREADFAAWAADAEAERASLLATPEAALAALGIVKSDIISRAQALRANTRCQKT